MLTITVAVVTRDSLADAVRFIIIHPAHREEIVMRRTIDWANDTVVKIASDYIQSTWHVGQFHGERLVFESDTEATSTVGMTVYELDYDDLSSAKDVKTTQTYAVPDDAGSLMLAFSVIDATPYRTSFMLEPVAQEEHNEWHITVTGYPKLHSDLLEHFEWTGPRDESCSHGVGCIHHQYGDTSDG